MKVVFSPRGGCEAAIVAEIARARVQLDAMIFSFTSAAIANALCLAAGRRRVKVSVIADPFSRIEPGSKLDALKNAGVRVLIDSAHHLMHDKVLIIDAKRVVTGSFNWSFQAEHGNAENLITIPRKDIAAQYIFNWNAHAAHSMEL